MARRPLSMRKTKEILRLKHELGLTNRQIASSLHLSHVCVGNYLRRARQAGIGWPLPDALDEDQLRQLLLATGRPPAESRRYLPPMAEVHRELRRKGVTLQLLWEEYHRTHPEGYAYTQFWNTTVASAPSLIRPCDNRIRRASGCLWTGPG